MKLTKSQLREIIKEEIINMNLINEWGPLQTKWFRVRKQPRGSSLKHGDFELVNGGDHHTIKYKGTQIGSFHLDTGYTDNFWAILQVKGRIINIYASDIDDLFKKLKIEYKP